jgi:hypothetical protein
MERFVPYASDIFGALWPVGDVLLFEVVYIS